MSRAITTAALGLFLGTTALFLAAALSWGHFSTAPKDAALSMAFAWPFALTSTVLSGPSAIAAAVLVNYCFYILLAWLLLRLIRRALAAA
jgi:hypothetical protein